MSVDKFKFVGVIFESTIKRVMVNLKVNSWKYYAVSWGKFKFARVIHGSTMKWVGVN